MGGGTSGWLRFPVVLAASVIVAIAAAVLILPYPFLGDQSLFAVFARMITEGSELYRDIWDVTQPGIFWFFTLAGSWNGFSEVGIHAFEAGRPVDMYLSGANQSIPMNGWSPEFWTDDLWAQVAQDLRVSETQWLYLSDDALAISRVNAPWFEEMGHV